MTIESDREPMPVPMDPTMLVRAAKAFWWRLQTAIKTIPSQAELEDFGVDYISIELTDSMRAAAIACEEVSRQCQLAIARKALAFAQSDVDRQVETIRDLERGGPVHDS